MKPLLVQYNEGIFIHYMAKFFQRISYLFLIILQILIIAFFLAPYTHAEDTVAAPINPEITKCSLGIDTMFAQRSGDFENVLKEYAQFSEIPTMELVIRAKTGLLNLTTDAEEICQRNLSPDAPIPDAQRIQACRPKQVTTTAASPLNNTNELQKKNLREQCITKVENMRKKYENMIMGFATWDMNNKKIYAYAKALEDLNLALRSFSEDFEIIRGRLDQVIQGINYLVSGQNAGQ